jgi:uncharacterized membrane protein YccC
MTEHHDDAHNLSTFMGVGVALGAGIGAGLGVAIDNTALGVGVGSAIGVALAVGIWSARQTPMDRNDKRD